MWLTAARFFFSLDSIVTDVTVLNQRLTLKVSFVQVRRVNIERLVLVRHDLHIRTERGRVALEPQPEVFSVTVERQIDVRLGVGTPPAPVVLIRHVVRIVVERLVVQNVLVQPVT